MLKNAADMHSKSRSKEKTLILSPKLILSSRASSLLSAKHLPITRDDLVPVEIRSEDQVARADIDLLRREITAVLLGEERRHALLGIKRDADRLSFLQDVQDYDFGKVNLFIGYGGW